MSDNNAVLLLGNGINRCFSDISWNQLLINIARNNFVSVDTIDSPTLAFEQILNSILIQSKKATLENSTFSEIEKLDDLKSGYLELYKKYVELPITDILTTNFDYAIERALFSDFSYDKCKKHIAVIGETYRSTIRHYMLFDKRIFHIHGELGMRKTICLGTVHYMDNLTKIISKITKDTKDDSMVFDKDLLTHGLLRTWAQFFFTKDVYIVGLGLNTSDFDLWWLLTYRAQIYSEMGLSNNINYYYLYTGTKNQSFIDCLKVLKVNVREQQIIDDWEKTYYKIADNIKSELG